MSDARTTPDDLQRRLAEAAGPDGRLDVALDVIAELTRRLDELELRVGARGF